LVCVRGAFQGEVKAIAEVWSLLAAFKGRNGACVPVVRASGDRGTCVPGGVRVALDVVHGGAGCG